MHKTRSLARHTAWYDGEPKNPKWSRFNPVSKHKSKHKNRIQNNDEENQIKQVPTNHSETCVAPSVEIKRIQDNIDGISMAQHADTMPLPSTKLDGYSSSSHATDSDRLGISQDSGTGTTDVVLSEKLGDDGKPRKRRLPFPHHQSGIAAEPEGSPASNPKPPRQAFTAFGQIRATIFNSWLNVLFVFIPIGIGMHFAKVGPVVVFTTNFVAIVPLAAMLSYATEEIALHTGETIGGLLNATFGNAVELIVSIIALVHHEVIIVQTSLIGSMLSNLLLVLGMCFFFGGIHRIEQFFNVTVAQTAASLLSLAVASLIIPAAFAAWSVGNAGDDNKHITALSRGTSILLLLVYMSYLYFQLGTHAAMYNEPSKKVERRKGKIGEGDANRGIANAGAGISATMGGEAAKRTPLREPEEEKEQPQLHVWVAVATLMVSTAFVGICAEFLVDSINDLVIQAHLSKTFVGLILLPIVGNAAEHATAVTVAIKDKMDLAIGVAIGSSMQIALLIIPFIVVLGWILGIDNMNLHFDGFQIATLFVAVLLVNYLISDGKSHWLEGILLNTLYLIIAIAAWFYPAQEDQ